jgi:hypothetical protein
MTKTMLKRVLLAGLLGGLAMFVWMSVAHMALPLGRAGIREIPNEEGLLGAMRASLGGAHGFYFFPALGSAGMDEYGKKLAANPSGILIYHPPGSLPMTPAQLAIEFLAEIIEALLIVYLLAQARLATYGERLAFVLIAGLLASLATNISYWNWYGFPGSYTAAYMITQLIGFLCVGLIAAAMLKPAPLEAASR